MQPCYLHRTLSLNFALLKTQLALAPSEKAIGSAVSATHARRSGNVPARCSFRCQESAHASFL